MNNSTAPVKIFFGGWAIHLETLQEPFNYRLEHIFRAETIPPASFLFRLPHHTAGFGKRLSAGSGFRVL